MEKDLLFEKLYEKTKNCGRVQFVKLLQHQQLVINRLSRKIQKLKRENLQIRNNVFCKEIISGHNEDVILIPNEIRKEIIEETAKVILEFEKGLINGNSNREFKGLYDSIKKGW